MSTRKKRQHYVPRSYLQRFQSDNSTEKVPRVWVVDRNNDQPFNVPIQTVASRDGFYDSILDATMSHYGQNAVENLLAEEEGKFLSSLRELDVAISKGEKIPSKVKAPISWYLYIQFIRTSKFRESLDESENNIPDFKKIAQLSGFANKEMVIRFISVCISSIWVVYRMPGRLITFTSDNPVVFTFDDPESAMKSALRNDDLTFTPNTGMRIMFPLDSKHVLFLYDRKAKPDKILMEDEVVDFDSSDAYTLWSTLINNCDRQIYIAKNDSMCEVIKLLMNFDNTLGPIREALGRAVDSIRNANSTIANTQLNSYRGFLERQKAQPLFEALSRLGNDSNNP